MGTHVGTLYPVPALVEQTHRVVAVVVAVKGPRESHTAQAGACHISLEVDVLTTPSLCIFCI